MTDTFDLAANLTGATPGRCERHDQNLPCQHVQCFGAVNGAPLGSLMTAL